MIEKLNATCAFCPLELIEWEERAAANARLIAAAPDLLEACKRAINTFRYAAGTFRARGHDTAAEAMILAEISTQAAITRAAGRLE